MGFGSGGNTMQYLLPRALSCVEYRWYTSSLTVLLRLFTIGRTGSSLAWSNCGIALSMAVDWESKISSATSLRRCHVLATPTVLHLMCSGCHPASPLSSLSASATCYVCTIPKSHPAILFIPTSTSTSTYLDRHFCNIRQTTPLPLDKARAIAPRRYLPNQT